MNPKLDRIDMTLMSSMERTRMVGRQLKRRLCARQLVFPIIQLFGDPFFGPINVLPGCDIKILD